MFTQVASREHLSFSRDMFGRGYSSCDYVSRIHIAMLPVGMRVVLSRSSVGLRKRVPGLGCNMHLTKEHQVEVARGSCATDSQL